MSQGPIKFKEDPFSQLHLEIRYLPGQVEIVLVGTFTDEDAVQKLRQKGLEIYRLLTADDNSHLSAASASDSISEKLVGHAQKVLSHWRRSPHSVPDLSGPSPKATNFIKSVIGWQISLSEEELENIRTWVRKSML